jgi:transcriptional regulator with XRE-family HTH domain
MEYNGRMPPIDVTLKRLRKAAGLTQEQVARRARLSHGYYSRLEMGRHDPPLSTLRAIAKALGVSVAELVK